MWKNQPFYLFRKVNPDLIFFVRIALLNSYNTFDMRVWVVVCQLEILKSEAENIVNIWIY